MFNTPTEAWMWAYKNIKSQDLRAIKIFKMLDAPRRSQEINVNHLAVLTFYSKRGTPPLPDVARETSASIYWLEVMASIEADLMKEGYLNYDHHQNPIDPKPNNMQCVQPTNP